MSAHGFEDFTPDELRVSTVRGSTLLVILPVLALEDDSSVDLSGYGVSSEIYHETLVAPVTEFTTVKTGNSVQISLTQAAVEALAVQSNGWLYRVWISSLGERRCVVEGSLVIKD